MNLKKSKFDNLYFALGVVVIFFIYLYTRYPVLNFEDSFKHFNSDNAIFIMMAEDIKTGSDFPFYYWGGNYLGPMNNAFMAFTQFIMELIGISQPMPTNPSREYVVGPLTATLNCFWMYFVGVIFFSLAFKRLYSVWESLAACLLLSIGSYVLTTASLRPLGPEAAFFLGGLLAWRGIALIQETTPRNQAIYGFLFGLTWWMNQMTVFVIAPLIFYFLAQSNLYSNLRNNLQIFDRLCLRLERLNLKAIPNPLKYFLQFVHFVISINFIMGLIVIIVGGVNDKFFGIKLKILNGFSPIKTSLMIFIGIQLILWLTRSDAPKKNLKKFFGPIKFAIIGFFIGYGPVLIGKIFKLFTIGASPNMHIIGFSAIPPYWQKLITEYFSTLFGVSGVTLVIPFFASCFALIFYYIYKNLDEVKSYVLFLPRKYSVTSVFWGVIFFNLIYIFISERARQEFPIRYSIFMMPVLSIFAVSSFKHFCSFGAKKLPWTIVASVLCLSFSYGQYRQGQGYVESIKNNDSIIPKLKLLTESECEVFFSDYWNVYVYEYFLQRDVKRFAVKRGMDRTSETTKKLEASNAKFCDLNGSNFEITKLNF